MQWQHGSFIQNSTGSLILTPIAVDGRQLLSEPCLYDNAIYTRWNQTITMEVSLTLASMNLIMSLSN